jgi:hypothetical protein
MRNKIITAVIVAALLVISATALILYKNRYQYEHQEKTLIRINIYTGETCSLVFANPPTPTPKTDADADIWSQGKPVSAADSMFWKALQVEGTPAPDSWTWTHCGQ